MTEIPPLKSFDEFSREATALVVPFVSRFNRLRWRDLDAPGPEHEYLIDGFLTLGDKSVVGGPSKSGKSFLSIHAGMSIARGTEFFGRKVRRGLVIYQAGEGARGIKKRLRAYRRHFNIPHDEDVPFELLQSKIDLYSPQGDTEALIEELKGIAAEYPYLNFAAFFIDTLATATGGADENSGKDMSTVMANIDKIERATGAHVCLVHHMNAGGTKLRGHSSIYANIDQVILVTRDEATKIRTAVLDKQKDDEDGIAIKFELMSVQVGERPDGRPITSCVCLEVGEKRALQKAEERKGFVLTTEEEKNLWSSFTKAVTDAGRVPPPEANAPEYAMAIQSSDWVKTYATFAMQGEGKGPSVGAIQKKVQRYGQRFKRFGLIDGAEHEARHWIWWTGKTVRGFPSPPTFAAPDHTERGGTDQIEPVWD